MNETDTSKQRAVAKSDKTANSLKTKQQASCPFYSVLPNENMVTALPLLAPAENTQYESEPQRSSPQQDWVAEPDGEKQAIIDSEFNKLLALNEELRSANNNLYEQVEDLTDTLEESEKALQLQKKRSSVTESLLNQQTQELAAAQEQINSLFQQLETAVQTVQRQETTVETYKAQLEISQQRLAQLERECALIQSNYTEQSHQLSQSESACRELRTRLMRQQRQTLQFKAALDKCLETPLPSYDSLNDYGLKQPRHSQRASSFSNTQTIQPWSVESECFTNEESASPAHQHDDLSDGIALQQTNQPEDLGQEVNCPIFDSSLALDIEDTLTPTPPAAAPEIIDGSTTPEAASPTISGNLDEQLDSVLQMFFKSQPASTSPPPPNRGEEGEKNNSVEQPIWEIFATSIPDTENSEDEVVTLNQKNSENSESENSDDYWSEMSTETTSPQSSFIDNSSDVNSPSPIVYPQRPPKRRKSLAFVELPNFRR